MSRRFRFNPRAVVRKLFHDLAHSSDLLYTLARYRRTFGRYPNLIRPKTFNEHLNQKKLFDRSPLLTVLADKYKVREYVRDRVGEEVLTRLYLVVDSPDQLDFSLLPDRFVIKATHGCQWNIVVTDKSEIDTAAIRQQLGQWISQNYYSRGGQWCYKNIPPRILVEEFLGDDDGEVPHDYKFFCFWGHVQCIQVDVGRFVNHRRNLYDLDWNLLDVRYKYDHTDVPIPRPGRLDEMVRIAESLAGGLDFVRVDLYGLSNRVCFGEMTHYPENGFGLFQPGSYDLFLGSCWSRRPQAP